MGDRRLHCGNRNFRHLLFLWRWPRLDELYIRTWPVLLRHRMCIVQIWFELLTELYEAKNLLLLIRLNEQLEIHVAIARPSDCRSSVCLYSVTFVYPTQGNVSTPFSTLAISDLSVKILRRSSQGNPSVEGLKARRVAKYSDFEILKAISRKRWKIWYKLGYY